MTSSTATTDVSQRINSILGGTVIGVQYNIASPKREPPSAEQVIAYLSAIEAPGAAEKSQALQRFYEAEFRVVGQDPHQELGEAIHQIWSEGNDGQPPPGIVLLAESGSGKTLALVKLCKQLADQNLPRWQEFAARQAGPQAPDASTGRWPPQAPVPLLINLADLQSGAPLLSLARACFNGKVRSQVQDSQIEELLPACVVFLDGLDEIPQGGGAESIRLFMQEFARTRFVVTARATADYQQLGPLRVLRLADLDAEQVKTIMGPEQWGTANESMRQLACNRSLLKMILAQKDGPAIWTKGHLVRAWIAERLELLSDEADREIMDGVLGRLAYAMQRDQTCRYDERQVMEVVNAYAREWHEDRPWRAVAALLRNEKLGLMERSEDGRWAFRARLTQAYYAAAAITRDPTLLPVALERASDPWWFETWDLLVGLSTDPSALMIGLIDQDPVAAARCMVFSGVPLTPYLANAIFDALQERRTFGRSADRGKVVESIGWFNHPNTRKELLKAVMEEPYTSVVLMGVGKYCQLVQQDTSSLPTDQETKASIRGHNSEEAVRGLFDLWRRYTAATAKEQRGIESYLIRLMRGTRIKKHVSGVAAIMLGLIGQDAAREALCAKFRETETNEFLAWCVTDALGQIQHPATEQAALEVYGSAAYQDDAHIDQRARAIYLLGWMKPSEPALVVVRKALEDLSPEIRRRAAQSLGRWRVNWSRTLLEERLRREHDEKVIDKIVQALGPVGVLETLPLLEACLRRAQRAATRRHIRNAMDEIRSRHAA